MLLDSNKFKFNNLLSLSDRLLHKVAILYICVKALPKPYPT